jgi:predicted secreted hydrolase
LSFRAKRENLKFSFGKRYTRISMRWAAVFGLVMVTTLLWYALRPLPPPPAPESLELAAVLGGEPDPGFVRATVPRAFQFPRDHGPHPGFRSEWWYFTGQLRATDGRRFGYELSLFRTALSPAKPARTSRFAANEVYMGHFALTDIAARRFRYFERFARGAAGLAGAQTEPFAVWVEDWSVRASPDNPGTWALTASSGDVRLELALAPQKPPALHGDRGLSQKSAEPGSASYYYSIPRLAARGTLAVGGETLPVTGGGWLDREWSTSALSPEQSGWDWFGLQLADGSELMFYQLRRKDGSRDPHSAGTFIDAAGRAIRLRSGDVALEEREWWQSPRGGRYPAAWQLTVRPLDLALDIRPLLADQELDVSIRYWEGAVDVSGTRAGRPVRGEGYVELTGYAENRRR